jgi:hypothetical protein
MESKVTMSYEITRSNVVVAWFVFVTVVSITAVLFGLSTGRSTAAWLAALSVVPPALLLMLWPGVQPQTAREVIRGEIRL